MEKVDLKWSESAEAGRAVPALVEALKDESEAVREAAAAALSRIGRNAKEALSVLEKMAKSDAADFVREAAASSVMKIRGY